MKQPLTSRAFYKNDWQVNWNTQDRIVGVMMSLKASEGVSWKLFVM